MVSEEALKKLQEQIAAWPMTQRFVVQQLIEDYSNARKDLLAYKNTGLTPEGIAAMQHTLSEYHKVADPLLRAQADGRLVVHGRWIHSRYEDCSEQFELVKCSQCNHEAYAMAFYVRGGNYCPNCGAKMNGGAENG